MTPELKNLYRQTLLAHSKDPKNNYAIPETPSITLRNPLCGDEITVYLDSNHKISIKVTFTAQACSICMASASLMTETLSELSPQDGFKLAQSFVSNFKEQNKSYQPSGELAALSGVLEFPSRIRCATLPWEALLKLPR